MAGVESDIVEVCVFKFIKGDPNYLLLKRSVNEKLYPGIWQLVTGTREKHENAIRTVRRELEEETGLRATRLWVVPFVDSYYDADRDVIQLSPFFAAQVEERQEPDLSSEHGAYGWFSFEGAKEKLEWPGHRQGITMVHAYVVKRMHAAHLTEVTHSSH